MHAKISEKRKKALPVRKVVYAEEKKKTNKKMILSPPASPNITEKRGEIMNFSNYSAQKILKGSEIIKRKGFGGCKKWRFPPDDGEKNAVKKRKKDFFYQFTLQFTRANYAYLTKSIVKVYQVFVPATGKGLQATMVARPFSLQDFTAN